MNWLIFWVFSASQLIGYAIKMCMRNKTTTSDKTSYLFEVKIFIRLEIRNQFIYHTLNFHYVRLLYFTRVVYFYNL